MLEKPDPLHQGRKALVGPVWYWVTDGLLALAR
jgi:predicted chitinase